MDYSAQQAGNGYFGHQNPGFAPLAHQHAPLPADYASPPVYGYAFSPNMAHEPNLPNLVTQTHVHHHLQSQDENLNQNMQSPNMAHSVAAYNQAHLVPGLVHQPYPNSPSLMLPSNAAPMPFPSTLQSSGHTFAGIEAQGHEPPVSAQSNLALRRPHAPSGLGAPPMVRSPRSGGGDRQALERTTGRQRGMTNQNLPSAETRDSWSTFLNDDDEDGK
ncbi:hypothetical protein CDD81_3432 [Ophiocordyceps australis]|uniref:Uncharacterized protein n=1 Tax=Ophiocordyceps australis TaxID=1399860 RepID=A0A2C5YDI4_9HYPO|nr:hypothetical protein CDD81_3432 [Ophiocordyceps australis]